MKNLTENLQQWRKERNIKTANYYSFIGNILEELMEPLYENKDLIEEKKQEILKDIFNDTNNKDVKELDIVDTLQDIQVFAINETELMKYDNLKCNEEVFRHINCRKQDPIQKFEWQKNGQIGKWKKWCEQPKSEIYEPDYKKYKLLKF